jgi:RNA polymerase sigma-70 factor (ECF subfamily)
MDFEPLLARLRAGDDSALAPLFALFEPRLRRMVGLRLDRRLVTRVSESDVLQETYLSALQRLRHFLAQPELQPYGWFRALAVQRLIDLHRQHVCAQARSTEQEISLDRASGPAASSLGLARAFAAELATPSRTMIQDESRAQLETALDEIEPLDREVLALRHFEELDNRETAELLGVSEAAASKRYLRALARLRAILERMRRGRSE